MSHHRAGKQMNECTKWPARGLYLLTPDESDTRQLLARVAPLLDAGIAVLQLRNKHADA